MRSKDSIDGFPLDGEFEFFKWPPITLIIVL
jgi:hypothetical protein